MAEELEGDVLQRHERVFWKMYREAESKDGMDLMLRCL